ncbi:MAG: hypothetical protein II838_13560 [Lachnospiraceae bacterium]|nr:hypothetical protein [Lachnospiraceae bacterium]
MVDSKENIVRILFPNKVLNGRVLGGAFVLRPLRQETYLSVFRIAGGTFVNDISKLDAGRNLQCGVMNVGEVRSVKILQKLSSLLCDVIETGDITITSHAGIIIKINGQQLIGGRESDIVLDADDGESMDALVLAMQHRLAVIAQKGLTRVDNLIK